MTITLATRRFYEKRLNELWQKAFKIDDNEMMAIVERYQMGEEEEDE